MRAALVQIPLLIVLAVLPGCSLKQSPAVANLRATDTPARVPAIVRAADDSGDSAELAELVHALSDKDPAVRLFAIQSLQERTGQTMGYRYYEAYDKRQPATERWHAWLNASHTTRLALPDERHHTD